MTDEMSLLGYAKDLFSALAIALSAETEEQLRELYEVVHRSLVVFDDYLCQRFSFSRKPRGKYITRQIHKGE